MKNWRWLSDEEKTKRLDLILNLREQKLLHKQIGHQIGVNASRVSQILTDNRNGVVCRARAISRY